MASNYPTSLDNFNNPSGTDSLNSPSHSLQHSDINDAVEAIEAKVGIGASPAGSATAGQVLTAQGGGTALWADVTGGLTLINTTNFSAVATQSVNDVFSSTYDYYLILSDLTPSTNSSLSFRLRVAGSDAAGANTYTLERLIADSTSVTAARLTQDKGQLSNYYTSGINTNVFYLFNPFLAEPTGFQVHSQPHDIISLQYGYHTPSTSYTGFTLIAGSGTLTGTVTTYGVKK